MHCNLQSVTACGKRQTSEHFNARQNANKLLQVGSILHANPCSTLFAPLSADLSWGLGAIDRILVPGYAVRLCLSGVTS